MSNNINDERKIIPKIIVTTYYLLLLLFIPLCYILQNAYKIWSICFLSAFHFPFQSESFAIVYGAHSGTIVLTKERCLERIARGDIFIFIIERLCICAAINISFKKIVKLIQRWSIYFRFSLDYEIHFLFEITNKLKKKDNNNCIFGSP